MFAQGHVMFVTGLATKGNIRASGKMIVPKKDEFLQNIGFGSNHPFHPPAAPGGDAEKFSVVVATGIDPGFA